MSKRSALSGASQGGLPTVNAAWWPPGTPLITWGLTGQSDLADATWEVKPLRRNGLAPGKKKATRGYLAAFVLLLSFQGVLPGVAPVLSRVLISGCPVSAWNHWPGTLPGMAESAGIRPGTTIPQETP